MRTGRDNESVIPAFYNTESLARFPVWLLYIIWQGNVSQTSLAVESKGTVRAVARTLICGQIPRNFM